MSRALRAELHKLRRRRVLGGAVVAVVAFSLLAVVTVVGSAADIPAGPRTATVASLSRAGGATDAFALGASFTGILVLVLFIAGFAGELAQGTFRTLLLRQPRRMALLAGKHLALLGVLALGLLAGELLSAALSFAMAGGKDVATGDWLSGEGLVDALQDYATALGGLAAWATFGAALGMLTRSVPLGLGLGIVWSGPVEHLLQDAWTPASDWFPGLLLEDLVAGVAPPPGTLAGAAIVAAYALLAAGAAGLAFSRRDITA